MKHNLYILMLRILPKKYAHMILYKRTMKKNLNINNPKDFNEKIQYLIVNKYGEREATLTDKILVKDYIETLKIKDLYYSKLLKVYNNSNEINLDELPEKFVIKCNHGAGDVFVCTSKDTFDIDNCKRKLQKNLNINYQNVFLEYHYKYIKPHIMVEEYLDDGVNINPYDYKFYCFNGTVHSILVCSNRENTLKFNDFDKNWNELKYTKQEYRGSKEIKKPSNLDKMIKIAQQLSSPFPFVRIDLYNINGKIYFGEFTFSPSAGLKRYYTQEALDILGDKLDLSLYN